MMGISRRAFGRLIGVSVSSVQKAIDSGRITTLPDGSLDPVAARAQWQANTDPARLKAGGRSRSDGRDFQAARTRDVILKAEERELKMAERRKELVPLARVSEHVSKAFISYKQAMQRLPSRHAASIAAAVRCDAGALEEAMSAAIRTELEALSAPIVRG